MNFLTVLIIGSGLTLMCLSDEKVQKKIKKKFDQRKEKMILDEKERKKQEALEQIELMKEMKESELQEGYKIREFVTTDALLDTQIKYLNDELVRYFKSTPKEQVNETIREKVKKMNEVILKTEKETANVKQKVEERIWLEVSKISKELELEENKKIEMITRKLD